MHTEPNASPHTAVNIVPPLRPVAPWRVAEVSLLDNYRLHVTFNDGISGIVDLSKRVTADNAGVFSALGDNAMFSTVHLHLGVVTWDCGVDLAPDAMHDALAQEGVWDLV